MITGRIRQNIDLCFRLRWMALGWGSVALLYFPCAFLQGQATILGPSWVDELIPYTQWALWPYLSFFALIPYAYLRCSRTRVQWLARSMQLLMLVCAAIYLCWPTALEPQAVAPAGLTGALVRLLVFIDTPNNCLPSLHAGLSLLAVLALWLPGWRTRNFFLALWLAVISVSIIALRRHLFIDWLTGSALAAALGIACRRWMAGRRASECPAKGSAAGL